MRHLLKSLFTALLSTSFLALTAKAQSSDFEDLYRPNGPEVRATVTIPFGVNRKTSKNDSRLELGVRSYKNNNDSFDWALKGNGTALLPDYHETRIGLTLESDTKVMLNGQEWTQMNQTLGLDDNAKSELKPGVGVVLIGAVLGIALFVLLSQQQSD